MKTKRLLAWTVAVLLIFGLGTQCFAIYLPDGTSNDGTSGPSEPVHVHSFSEWIVTEEPTCSEFGKCYRVCGCGEVEYGFVDKLPHTFGEWEVIEDPTDNSAGLQVHTCQVCGETEREQIIPAGTILPGTQGTDVEWLQGALVENGYMDSQNQDGLYGRETENAVREAQKGNGLPQDGTAWPGTIESLIHDFSGWITVKEPTYQEPGIMERTCMKCGYTERFEIGKRVNPGSYGDEVKAIQEALERLGYPVGETDGSYGRHTDRAVAQWQKDHGYEADGIVWPGVWNELFPGMRPDRPVTEDDDRNPAKASMINYEADDNGRNFFDVLRVDEKDDGEPDGDPPGDESPMTKGYVELNAVLEIEILTEPKMGENGPYYEYGQTVEYRYVLKNLSKYTIRDIIAIPLTLEEFTMLNTIESYNQIEYPESSHALVFRHDEIGPGQAAYWPPLQGYYYTEDIAGADGRWYILATAFCNFYDGETFLGSTQPIGEATFKYGNKEEKRISAELEYQVLDEPKNGLFFTDGEKVRYNLWLTNTSDYNITEITGHQVTKAYFVWVDGHNGKHTFSFKDPLPSGKQVSWGPYEMRIYTPSEDNPDRDHISGNSSAVPGAQTGSSLDGGMMLSAFSVSKFEDGGEYIGSYPSVAEEFIPIDVEKPDARLEIVETSAPANGIYYTEGESFEADFILTNTGNIVLTGGDVYINQTETWSQLVGTAVSLEPGKSQTVFHYSEPVLPIHVERGFQDISAKAECSFKSAKAGTAVTRNAEHTFPAGYKPEAVLKVNEISSPSNTYFYEENETIAYELVVENIGKVDMESATLSFSAGGVSYDNFAKLGPLPAGASSKPVSIGCSVTHDIAQAGKLTVDGKAEGVFLHGMELTMTDSAVSFTGIPALKTSISVVNPPETFFKRDDTIHYAIIVTNIGNVDIPKVDVYLETPEGRSYIHTSALFF